MAYDGLVVGAITLELNSLLGEGRIDKIYHPEKEELIFNISANKEKYRLYISANSANPRMHLLRDEDKLLNPQNPTAFCMLIRKHFQGGRIKEIRQVEAERIIEISVVQRDELGFNVDKKLIVEIMGKHSNIIALDCQTDKIIDSIKRIPMELNRYRQILPGLDYVSPPDQGKVCFYDVKQDHIDKILAMDKPLAKALLNGIQGISPVMAEEIATNHSHDMAKTINAMTLSLQSGNYTPRVYVDETGKPFDFHIFPLTDAEGYYKKIEFDNVNDAIDYYYSNKMASNRIKQKASDVSRAVNSILDKLYLKNQKLSQELLSAENSDQLRIFGELLTANIHNIPKGTSEATVMNYYDNQEIKIPLDPRFSAADNAQRYFKRYSKAKTAIKEKKIQIDETQISIDYLESVLVYVENADTADGIEEIRRELAEGGYLRKRKDVYRNSKSKLQPLVFTDGDGSRILVGRNNKENDYLTFKTASKKDMWFHTKDIPGSHVILANDRGDYSEESLHLAASLAAYYSKARNSSNVAVDYTTVRHVKKTPGAKPGMVIYTNHKTLYVDPKAGI